MQLTDLGLNRYLYKDVYDETPDSSLVASNNTDFSSSGDGDNTPEPGSIITSVILQSSPSDDRIEINPDDTFKAYNSGDVVVLIDKNGIVADNLTVENETIVNSEIINLTVENATIENATIENAFIENAEIDDAEITDADITNAVIDVLEVTSYFIYAGYLQPQVFGGEIDSAGTAVLLPPTWTCLRVSLGLYLIVHNLGNTDYDVTISPVDGHFRGKVFSKIAGSFLVSYQETVYGSDTFPVTGGAGGSVTVDGIRISPFETQVDTGFNFILVNNLP